MQLHDYQKKAVELIKQNPKCALFMQMGTGKTLATLIALSEIKPAGHILIIAPKNIAMSTWQDEIKKWGIKCRTKSFLLTDKGTKLSRAKRLELYKSIPTEPPSVWFINRELLPDLIDNMPKKNGKTIWLFPTVVIDELQGFKNPNAIRFKKLKPLLNQITRFIGLTGTPTPNGLMDLWSEIYLIDNGKRLYPTITKYREMFFTPTLYVNGYAVNWKPRENSEQIIYDCIRDVVLSVKNTNLKLPPVTYNTIPIFLTNKEKKIYTKFAKTAVMELNGTEISATNAAVLQAKLSQIASGTIYTDENHNYEVIHQHKSEMCEYIINNTDSPVIIAYHFKSDKAELCAYLKDHNIDVTVFDGSPEMVHSWNAGEIPVLLIQPASAGHGLNLQYGGHTLIWYTLPWSLEHWLQTNARLDRQGQTQPVMIHMLITQGSVDTKIQRVLENKNADEESLLKALEDTINDIKERGN